MNLGFIINQLGTVAGQFVSTSCIIIFLVNSAIDVGYHFLLKEKERISSMIALSGGLLAFLYRCAIKDGGFPWDH